MIFSFSLTNTKSSAIATAEISTAVILGTTLGPLIYLYSTEWSLLFAGLIAGTIAFIFGEKNGV